MKKIRVALIGTGFAGGYHVQCLRKVYGYDVDIVGVYSLREQSRREFGRRHGIKVYDDAAAMIADADIVDICSPPYTHKDFISMAADAGAGVICEKPLTGFFTDDGENCCREKMFDDVLKSLTKLRDKVKAGGIFFGYAENFVYTPAVQKEREIVTKTGAQILRMTGEESHNGSASDVYGIWKYSGGGSLIGKGVHPLGGMLYLKRVEGLARNGCPIRPVRVCAKTHKLTRLAGYIDKSMIRTDYKDVEDYGFMHITFSDGTVGDVLTSEVVLGGIYDYIEVFANNHRTRCAISPVHIADTYNPRGVQYDDIYTIEKCSTKEGWSPAAPDENFTMGYQPQVQDFITSFANGEKPQSDIELAIDTTAAVYAAYLSDRNNGIETEIPNL